MPAGENLTARGVDRRRRLGIFALAVGVLAAAALIALHAPRWTRGLLVVPFGIGIAGVLQARERTCVALAAVSMREEPDGSYCSVSAADTGRARRVAAWILVRA